MHQSVVSNDLIDESIGFGQMGLDSRLLQAVTDMGFLNPTLVQAKAIPLALQGKDILARARTGSGKTAAYCIPIVQKILTIKANGGNAIRGLVLVPTRELAEQVTRHIRLLVKYATDVKAVNIAQSDVTLASQQAVLAELPDVVVATPSKAVVHIEAGNMDLSQSLESLVIDEADLILSYGYSDDVKKLLGGKLPKIFQSYLMSATLSDDITQLKQLVLRSPAVLKLNESSLEKAMLEQYAVECSEEEKFLYIFFILKLHVHPFGSGKSIIFVNSVERCYKLKLFLEQFGIKSCALNSELPLKSRYHIVQEFNKGVYDFIIATDESGQLKSTMDSDQEEEESQKKKKKKRNSRKDSEYGVSRGIDFVNVRAVINFDLPRSSRAYQHRVGRTARGVGNKGFALSFILKSKESDPVTKKRKVSQSDSQPAIKQASDQSLFKRIQKRQAALEREIKQFAFDMAQVDGFRYRCLDALRAVTSVSVRDARIKEIKTEILNSEKLKTHFEDNPQDMQALRHDQPLHPARVQAHMRNVPTYLMPKGHVKVSEACEGGNVPFKVDKKRKWKPKKTSKASSAATKRNSDPLKSLQV